jgi:hypothetical protein
MWFSVAELKDAFWACPLVKNTRDIAAFEWEDPQSGRKQQCRWTALPQAFTGLRTSVQGVFPPLQDKFITMCT